MDLIQSVIGGLSRRLSVLGRSLTFCGWGGGRDCSLSPWSPDVLSVDFNTAS